LLTVVLFVSDRDGNGADETAPVFEGDVRPVLAAKCGKCHSDKVQKGGLDLSSMAGVRLGGESGEAAIGESLDESLLWAYVEAGDMPPEAQPPLTEQEVELLRRWISSGAQSTMPVDIEAKPPNQHDVLPIVLLRCTACHGARLQRGAVDLRTPELMLKGGNNGPALVPGDPDRSLMIQRIVSEACPPREQLLKYFVRRPPAAEVEMLRKWIAAGAPVVDVPPDVATSEPDPLVTDEDRQHWAFQTPVADPDAESIDEFIAARLKDADLTFSPEAGRDTLVRRAYLDLVGMPPSLDEWRRWHSSEDSNWYAAMVDHLLASPHYGERWGRYWLDLAGYADSEGGVSADPVREVAWKYRDYVVRSFNNDTPYDRFLIEQLAGDELIDVEKADVVTDEMVNNLIATGFLRMGIDQTGSRTMNFVPERLGVIGDAINVIGSSVMGLTLECARCHSHKYDALPQRDYYRFKAIFQGAFDEHDWLSFKNRKLQIGTPEHRQRVAKVNPPLQKELKQLEAQKKKAIANVQLALLRGHYPDQPEADRQTTLAALRIADNNRTLTQRTLVEMLQRAEVIPHDRQPQAVVVARDEVADIEQQIIDVKRHMEPPLTIRAVWDRGEPSPTYVLRRGEHDKPGNLVGPGVPSVLTDGRTPFAAEPPFQDGTSKTGRRLAFARWLTQPEHPLTARVFVNRVWYHHFGSGLVRSLENFGVKGERPSHPELLDWLAVEFVKRGWSIKELHRLIMNSSAYRQSSRVTEERLQRDPLNRLLSRMPLRRMNAEAIRDSLLFVSDSLDDSIGGPPDPITVDRDGQVSVVPTSPGQWRRSIYTQYRRTEIPTLMATFDYPVMGPNCVERSVSTVSLQSLMLTNNEHVRDLAAAFAARVESLHHGADDAEPAALVDAVYQLALSRMPNDMERRLGIGALAELQDKWQDEPHKALETYCHTILNSAAFLYVD
jgi:cytochrome c553